MKRNKQITKKTKRFLRLGFPFGLKNMDKEGF